MLRDALSAILLFLPLTPVANADKWAAQSLSCSGITKQSGLVRCKGPAGLDLDIKGPEGELLRTVRTDETGEVFIGLRQHEPSPIEIAPQAGPIPPISLTVASRQDDFRLITGFNCDKVDARTEAQKQHAAESWVKKQNAFASFNKGPASREGFRRPVEGRTSSPFGPTRKYKGVGKDGEPCEKTSVHEGYDFAVPTGTPVYAPAGGTVVLADPDLYYEGGTIFLDHGGGLVSVFLHLSDIAVEAGEFVPQGEKLGATGNTGRTTGPHLHWAVKWRNEAADTRDEDFYIDPALLLTLTP
ncbi:MAG: M23 family metallopeptidase [Pseudomonadota bacterium]|nr:M23 family metallopeptidase [Pseudomonadota bacterium]